MLFDAYDPNTGHSYGQRHPDLPSEFDLFAFMIGRFDCNDRLLMPDGSWKEMRATWISRYTLNGQAIQDQYRNEIYAGASIRRWLAEENHWAVTFFGAPDGHSGIWRGGQMGDKIVLTCPQTTADGQTITSRLSFSDICADSFNWLGEKVMADGTATANWRITARRVE